MKKGRKEERKVGVVLVFVFSPRGLGAGSEGKREETRKKMKSFLSYCDGKKGVEERAENHTHTHPPLITSIHKRNKPPPPIPRPPLPALPLPRPQTHPPHPRHHKRLKPPHQLQIIRRPHRPPHQLLKLKPRTSPPCPRHLNLPAPHPHHHPLRWSFIPIPITISIPQVRKPLRRMSRRSRFVERMVIDTGRGTGETAVVGAGVEVDDAEVGGEESDAREEGGALDAVLVEVSWVSV